MSAYNLPPIRKRHQHCLARNRCFCYYSSGIVISLFHPSIGTYLPTLSTPATTAATRWIVRFSSGSRVNLCGGKHRPPTAIRSQRRDIVASSLALLMPRPLSYAPSLCTSAISWEGTCLRECRSTKGSMHYQSESLKATRIIPFHQSGT